MSNPWPSPLPGDAWRAWRTAWEHIERKTLAGISVEDYRILMRDAQVQAAAERCARMAQSGDVLATQTSAQAWNLACKRAVARLHAQETAA